MNSLAAIISSAGQEAVHACKILIIDDEEPNVRVLELLLTKAGFRNFVSTTDPREAATLFTEFDPDLVLTDLFMPYFDGCAVMKQISNLISVDDYLPIVVLTADVSAETRKRALTAGATDFLTKPFDQIEVLLRIRNLLKARLSHLSMRANTATLEASVRQRTFELEKTLEELRQSQTQVIQQERLAAFGTMAGGIAHDFNNVLSIIMGFSEMLLRDAELGHNQQDVVPSLTTIITAAEDAAKIVHRLREFYRPDEAPDRHLPVDLNRLVEQAIALTEPRWRTQAAADGREIVVVAELDREAIVNGNATEIREVLTNLIFNSVDALPVGGSITLRTRTENGTVALAISDTGAGMSEEVRSRCLEPFFSTKGTCGTGLGLAMVLGIIHRHAGTIDIESELGKGTTFTLRLPAACTEGIPLLADEMAPPEPLHILVVDDQPILCKLVCEYLKDDLHTVEMATDGDQALEAFRATDFDLVITDHVMTKMSGPQLAVAIKELKPSVPLILLTGYVDHKPLDTECPPAIDLVLVKPLSRTALRHALAQATAGSNSRCHVVPQ